MSTTQFETRYMSLCKKYGEKQVRETIVAKLRDAANNIEAGKFPDIFDCTIENMNLTVCSEGIMEKVSVTLSHPWPG